MKKLISVLLSLTLVIAFCIPAVRADGSSDGEEIDWSTVDWETFDYNFFYGDGYAYYDSLEQYMMKEADLESVLEYVRYLDGALAEAFDGIIRYRFMQEPEELLILLEKEEEYVQKYVIFSIYYFITDEDDPWEFVDVLNNVRLDPEAYPQAVGFLNEIIAGTQERLGIDISNPKTGDITPLPLWGLLLGAAGLVFTKRKLVPEI